MLLRHNCIAFLMIFLLDAPVISQEDGKFIPEVETYGSLRLFNTFHLQSQDPKWNDVMRPSKLLDENGQPYGTGGNYSLSVRPSMLGIKLNQNTPQGPVKFCFEFDFLGRGAYEGETFFRLRRLYFIWHRLTVGQHNSLFMDAGAIPNTVEFFSPNGMAIIRNIQLSYQLIKNQQNELAIGIENPSATSDLGPYDREFTYADALDEVNFVTVMPAITGHYKYSHRKGHIQLASVLKNISWRDNGKTMNQDLSGSDWGLGLNLTGVLNLSPNVRFKGSFTAGKGIQNFINDGSSDLGVKRDYNSTLKPIVGEAIPFYSFMIYNEIRWSQKWNSSMGLSYFQNNTFPTQLNTSFRSGSYATAGVFYQPFTSMKFGLEYQYGKRQNADFKGDPSFNLPAETGNSYSANQFQFLVNYVFSTKP